MRWGGAVLLVLALANTGNAGEILFANGSRLDGELANEVLMVSTGSGLLEVSPEQVVLLTQDEIRLKDGRVIRGTLVGGHIKARTALGEIAIKADELRAFSVAGSVAKTASEPTPPTPVGAVADAPVGAGAGRARWATGPGGSSAETSAAGASALPTMSPQEGTPAPPEPARSPASTDASLGASSATRPTVAALAPGPTSATTSQARRLEVVAGESPLYRDAFATASRIGRVIQGDQVTYLDSIDRRLRILNALIFDGGHWIKVRSADGTEGWVPADIVREAR